MAAVPHCPQLPRHIRLKEIVTAFAALWGAVAGLSSIDTKLCYAV